MKMRLCRYRSCQKAFVPPKPNYYFCSWDCHQAHMEGNDYRGYRRQSDQSYDRGFWDGTKATPTRPPEMPTRIWKALALLAHPDKWQSAPVGIKEMSHEAMLWLLDHRPSDAGRN